MKQTLKKYAIRILVFSFILATTITLSTTDLSRQRELQTTILPEVIYNLSNQNRVKEELSELKVSPLLEKAAQAKANDMAKRSYFSHLSPEGFGPLHWFQLVRYKIIFGGENLAVMFSDSEDVVNAWMASEAHRRNILNQRFTETGIATAKGVYKGKETVFVVQMFGTPMPTFNR